MSRIQQTQRARYRDDWRRLIAEARACADDLERSRKALSALAHAAPGDWYAPTDRTLDTKAVHLFAGLASVYAREAHKPRARMLAVALRTLADVAEAILTASDPAARREAENVMRPHWLERED